MPTVHVKGTSIHTAIALQEKTLQVQMKSLEVGSWPDGVSPPVLLPILSCAATLTYFSPSSCSVWVGEAEEGGSTSYMCKKV